MRMSEDEYETDRHYSEYSEDDSDVDFEGQVFIAEDVEPPKIEWLMKANKHRDDVLEIMTEALFYVMDVPDECKVLRYSILNRDMLCPREFKISDVNVNYLQLLCLEGAERDPLDVAFSYLFTNHELRYREPYNFSEEEKEERKVFHKHLVQKYGDAQTYIDRLDKRMWLCSGLDEISKCSYTDTVSYVFQGKR